MDISEHSRTPPEIAPVNAYQTAVRRLLDGNLHQPEGRAIVLDGRVFYSPNTSRCPAAIPKPLESLERNPYTDDVEEFHQPQWFTPKAGYLPFLPTNPNFVAYPFDALVVQPAQYRRKRQKQYQMNSADALRWNRLEHTLNQIFQVFVSGYSIPDMPPMVRTSLACQQVFQWAGQYAAAEKRSRKWFALWMARVSFAMAVAQAHDKEVQLDGLPRWFKIFARHTDEKTMSALREQLGQFTLRYPRAGVFIDLENQSFPHPAVDFFVRFGIPVWYAWGPSEEEHLRKGTEYWRRLAPPPHLLQRVHQGISASPRAPAPHAGDEPLVEAVKPWEAFFRERDMRRGSQQRAGRRPPRKVFHWERDDDGRWVRQAVLKAMQAETLGDYGESQKRFDEFSNEWDCCTEMGELDAEEQQARDWAESDDEPILPIKKGSVASKVHGLQQQPDEHGAWDVGSAVVAYHNPMPSPEPTSEPSASQSEPFGPHFYAPCEILTLFFGFLPPSNLADYQSATISESQERSLCLGTGFDVAGVSRDFLASPVGRAAAIFWDATAQTPWTPPPNRLYDLSTSAAERFIGQSRRLRALRYLRDDDVYVFDFGLNSWYLALKDVVAVLFVLRLPADYDQHDIAWHLLILGIPFLTLLRMPRAPVAMIHPTMPRIRLSTYAFTKGDYDEYCSSRDDLLRSSRFSRLALKHGGIVWRLALDSASFDNVLAGPTAAATLSMECCSYDTMPQTDVCFVDDDVHPSYWERLTGCYSVFTGQGNQMSKRSWWPTAELWDSLVNHSFWTARSERFYRNRLAELASGNAQPLTSTQWRGKMKDNSVVRRGAKNNKDAARAFLKSQRIQPAHFALATARCMSSISTLPERLNQSATSSPTPSTSVPRYNFFGLASDDTSASDVDEEVLSGPRTFRADFTQAPHVSHYDVVPSSMIISPPMLTEVEHLRLEMALIRAEREEARVARDALAWSLECLCTGLRRLKCDLEDPLRRDRVQDHRFKLIDSEMKIVLSDLDELFHSPMQ